MAITFNISASLFGGATPLLVSWLISETSNQLVPAYYVIFASIVGMIVVTIFLKDPSGKALRGSPPAVEEKAEIKEILGEPEEALWWHDEKEEIEERIEDGSDNEK